jgi:hypothetical protein
MEKYYMKSFKRGMSSIQYEERRLTGLVTYGVGTVFYNALLRER